ncbi:putative O-methyltransferase [Aspergillus saccharolyticus JOP 1030-1]|uniref:Putative O-methyltransferase n=1 Tax=Aspergillus saccharolyticus JOP 1030-1 TaxID=1450539 RepID=A0A318ZB73_9EURO|nr:putative O-methyltransferase [Aspergillus saccharolyticus JOP 1030-1]PYH40700.1 putative O-methyltransferase [Aspergillus saccharolyticus JOP 1030-1]
MERPELQTLYSLLDHVKACIALYEATYSDRARLQAYETSVKLTRALEDPKNAVFKLFLSLTRQPTQAMAVKIAHDLGLFAILAASDVAVSCKELADRSGAHPLLVERIMRVLVAMAFAQEHSGRKYCATLLSKEMVGKKSAIVDTLFVDIAPAILKTPKILRETNYQNPETPCAGPIQHTYGTPLATFDWLAENKPIQQRFHAYVEAVRAGQPYWVDWFPVQERILHDCCCGPDDPLIVDLAAGRGGDMWAFKRKFPDATGRVIIQDLPAVFQDVYGQDLGLERIEHDIFDPQPIIGKSTNFISCVANMGQELISHHAGARVYYLRWILHEFSDDGCRRILQGLTQVMRKGHSKILIEEFILPDENAGLFPSMVDMLLMVFGPGIARTEGRWRTMLTSVGLRVNLVAHANGEGPSIIEAEL